MAVYKAKVNNPNPKVAEKSKVVTKPVSTPSK